MNSPFGEPPASMPYPHHSINPQPPPCSLHSASPRRGTHWANANTTDPTGRQYALPNPTYLHPFPLNINNASTISNIKPFFLIQLLCKELFKVLFISRHSNCHWSSSIVLTTPLLCESRNLPCLQAVRRWVPYPYHRHGISGRQGY